MQRQICASCASSTGCEDPGPGHGTSSGLVKRCKKADPTRPISAPPALRAPAGQTRPPLLGGRRCRAAPHEGRGQDRPSQGRGRQKDSKTERGSGQKSTESADCHPEEVLCKALRPHSLGVILAVDADDAWQRQGVMADTIYPQRRYTQTQPPTR